MADEIQGEEWNEIKLKQLPDTGTRKRYNEIIFVLATVFALVITLGILLGKIDSEKLDMVMVVFKAWATLAGSVFGLYALSENLKKQSFAYMNKGT